MLLLVPTLGYDYGQHYSQNTECLFHDFHFAFQMSWFYVFCLDFSGGSTELSYFHMN